MSTRLSLLLSICGVPAFDHTRELDRIGYRIRTVTDGSVVWFEHPRLSKMNCLEEHTRIFGATTQVLAKSGVTYRVLQREIHVPATIDGRENVRPFSIPNPDAPKGRVRKKLAK